MEEYKPKSASALTTFTRYKQTRDQARKSQHHPTAEKPKHHSNANQGYLFPKIPLQSQPVVNATSIVAQLSSTPYISWGNCGIPGSFTYRRFLEEMAEEVAVQEGFEHAKILSTVHSDTCKGTKTDAPHWVGEFGPVPGPTMVKAHVYVLPNHQRGKKHRRKRLKFKGCYERSALGDIIYQKKWKPGVKYVQR